METNFKEGDKVRVKSLEWYNSNKDRYDEIGKGTFVFFNRMSEYCGKDFEVHCIYPDGSINLKGNEWCWGDWMFEEELITNTKEQRILEQIERVQAELEKLRLLINN